MWIVTGQAIVILAGLDRCHSIAVEMAIVAYLPGRNVEDVRILALVCIVAFAAISHLGGGVQP